MSHRCQAVSTAVSDRQPSRGKPTALAQPWRLYHSPAPSSAGGSRQRWGPRRATPRGQWTQTLRSRRKSRRHARFAVHVRQTHWVQLITPSARLPPQLLQPDHAPYSNFTNHNKQLNTVAYKNPRCRAARWGCPHPLPPGPHRRSVHTIAQEPHSLPVSGSSSGLTANFLKNSIASSLCACKQCIATGPTITPSQSHHKPMI